MMLRAIAVSLLLGVGGCAATLPPPAVTVAEKKVKEPCIERVPVEPQYQTGKGDWPGEKQAAVILADDFEKAEQYGNAWKAAAAGCLVLPPPK